MRLAIHYALNQVTPAMLVRVVVLAVTAYGLHHLAVLASLHVLQLAVAILGIALVAVAFNPYDSVPVEGGHDWTPPRRRRPAVAWTATPPTPPRVLRVPTAPRRIAVRVPAYWDGLEPLPLAFASDCELPAVPEQPEQPEEIEQPEQPEELEEFEHPDMEAPSTPTGALRTGRRGIPGAPPRPRPSRSASSSPSGVVEWGGCPQQL